MLEQRFLAFINDNRLVNPARPTLLTVSGGLDSVVMAELFSRAGLPFAVAHVNFGLRGAESDADAVFVQNRAEQYGVPFHLTRVDTAAVATERGISIQMAARELRYTWFAELLRKHEYGAIATAHHQNDVLETVLLNLTRGTGLAGLRGMPIRQDNVIRPLLFALRDDLTEYARQHGLTYREDSSNAHDKYARNAIRHHVVPVLTGLNPNLLHETLPRTLSKLQAAERIVQSELNRVWLRTVQYEERFIFLPAHTLLDLPEPAFYLAEWLKPYGFLPDQTDAMLASLSRETGQQFASPTYRVTHDRRVAAEATQTGLLLEPLPALTTYEITLPDWPNQPVAVPGVGILHVERFDRSANFQFPTEPTIACFDTDQLVFPLTIRPWQTGDRFRPLGMRGTKLVSDLLNDLKLTRTEREQTAVLVSGNQIVWVIGRRMAHEFRVTEATQRITRIKL
ncbi:MAG: tRNA lysidine(34) synthetase TilS [Spirosoma sp.]|nr:tRNA lysidine(34) synthetase TilS [Spirosoma sp.]